MLSLCHAKMPTALNSNLCDIWRSKRQPLASQWSKQMVEREKNETLKETKPKARPIEILSRPPEMSPEVKPFQPRNKGLARSEGLWQIYCNQPDPVLFDRSAESRGSSWPVAGTHTPEPLLPEQQESDEESLLFRPYEEKDFWGYLLPNTPFPEEREVTWGLSIPTDWQSPVHLSFPLCLLEDELIWEYPQPIDMDSNVPPRKSKLLNLFATMDLDKENETLVSEDPTALEIGGFDSEELKDTKTERNDLSESEESDNSCDVSVSCGAEIKTSVSSNLEYSMKDLLFGTPSRSDSRMRRNFSGVSHRVYENCNFYRSNTSPVVTVL